MSKKIYLTDESVCMTHQLQFYKRLGYLPKNDDHPSNILMTTRAAGHKNDYLPNVLIDES